MASHPVEVAFPYMVLGVVVAVVEAAVAGLGAVDYPGGLPNSLIHCAVKNTHASTNRIYKILSDLISAILNSIPYSTVIIPHSAKLWYRFLHIPSIFGGGKLMANLAK